MTKAKIIYIEWIDSNHRDSCRWENFKGLEEFVQDSPVIKTVGFKLFEDKDQIVISMMLSDTEDGYSHLQSIRKGCIIKQKKLT